MAKMNYSATSLLFNENIRAIATVYEPDTDKVKQTRYTFKSLDKSIKVDDLVIIPTTTRHNFTVVKVVAVDVEIDFESDIEYKWIVGKVDLSSYNHTLVEEAKWVDTLKLSEKRKKKLDIMKNVQDLVDDPNSLGKVGIASLPAIENRNATPPTPSPNYSKSSDDDLPI